MEGERMRKLLSVTVLGIILPLTGVGQEAATIEPTSQPADSPRMFQSPETPSQSTERKPAIARSSSTGLVSTSTAGQPGSIHGAVNRFSYFMTETYLNPSFFTAPAFSASIRMANPPGKGADRYPNEWRQGAEGFGRNYGDAFATRISTHTAQFVTGILTREDPGYVPSASRHFLVRGSHAFVFTFIDQSDSGRRVPALSNFAGAAAGGFVGNAYLPDGFRDATHAGQRAIFQFGMLAGGNLFREFARQMPVPARVFISLIAR
jgi:hypothetical protein